MSKEKSMNIMETLSAIQQEIKVHKGQYNSFGKYNYRSAEDILEALKPMMKKHKVTFHSSEELVEVGGQLAIKARALMSLGEQSIESCAYAIIDFDAKGMQMPQRTGAASSYGKKYAYGNLLLLDDTKDSDATNEHGKSETPKKSGGKPVMPADKFTKAVEAYNSGDDEMKKAVVERVNEFKLTEKQVKEFYNQTKCKL